MREQKCEYLVNFVGNTITSSDTLEFSLLIIFAAGFTPTAKLTVRKKVSIQIPDFILNCYLFSGKAHKVSQLERVPNFLLPMCNELPLGHILK